MWFNHVGITPKQVDPYPEYLLLNIHFETPIQSISLVLSCDPQPYVANPKKRTTALTLYV